MLSKLEISFAVFQESFEYYVKHKDKETQQEFILISKMQEKCRQQEDKQIQAEIGGQLLSRDVVLLIFE